MRLGSSLKGTLHPSSGGGFVYEFRFLCDGRLWAVHSAALANDDEACARARALMTTEPCDCVVVRSGVRFIRKLHRHGNPAESEAHTLPA